MPLKRRMLLRSAVGVISPLLLLSLADCAGRSRSSTVSAEPSDESSAGEEPPSMSTPQHGGSTPIPTDGALGTLVEGTMVDRGFVVDDLLQGSPAGDIHFSLHVPDSYDGDTPFALYVACPGWEGLWFQGVGAHLGEDFAFVANDYVPDMIIASPQLEDWGETSARQCIALTRWLMSAYNIDASRVYLSGYSGGGETISLVMGLEPALYRRALHLCSQWDGDLDVLAASRVPVRMSTGANDDYYGSAPVSRTYAQLREKYLAAGLSQEGIDELVVLDVKPDEYFEGHTDFYGEHGGGLELFPHDAEVMGWLFQ